MRLDYNDTMQQWISSVMNIYQWHLLPPPGCVHVADLVG